MKERKSLLVSVAILPKALESLHQGNKGHDLSRNKHLS